jgi:hypothetical protein
MPPTFSGSYVQEPSDLRVVCSESTIIAICDDAGSTEAAGKQLFAQLTADEKAVIVGVMNDLIRPAEELLESYARSRGYAIPLHPVDGTVKEIVAQLVWIAMRQRGGRLSGEQANKEREEIRGGQLSDIAKGRLILTATKDSAAPAPSSCFYAHSTAATRDKSGSVVRLSREKMRGL